MCCKEAKSLFHVQGSEANGVTQFSLADVRPVGSIDDELRVLADFLSESRE